MPISIRNNKNIVGYNLKSSVFTWFITQLFRQSVVHRGPNDCNVCITILILENKLIDYADDSTLIAVVLELWFQSPWTVTTASLWVVWPLAATQRLGILRKFWCQETDKRFYAFCTHERLRGPGLSHFTPTNSNDVTKGNKSLNWTWNKYFI